MTAMDKFQTSLSDEQLGAFFAIQYDLDCDDKLEDILTLPQYQLYKKAKGERRAKDDSESVLSCEKDDSVVSVTHSEAVSGTTSSTVNMRPIFLTLLAPVVEHLNRDKYALKSKLKLECSVVMSAQVDKNDGSHTFVKFSGTSTDSLLEAQCLLWKDLLPLQEQLKRLDNENIKAMWELSWDRIDQIAFVNRTNVQLEFTAGDRTVLRGFEMTHLEKAAALLVEYHSTGKRPSQEKFEKKTQKAKESVTNQTSAVKLRTDAPKGSVAKKPASFTMFIQQPVEKIVNNGNTLKNLIFQKYEITLECFEDMRINNQTIVKLHGDFGLFFDAEYDIFLHISPYQTLTNTIANQMIVEMWRTWSKREKVLFFLETNTFVEDGTHVLRGFQHLQLMKALNKLKEYCRFGTKPQPPNNKQKIDHNDKLEVGLNYSISNLSVTSNGSAVSNTSLQQGANATIRIEVENGEEKRIAALLIGTKGARVNELRRLYETVAIVDPHAGLVLVDLTAKAMDNIYKAEQHIWNRLREYQPCQKEYFLSDNHVWRLFDINERIQFQCDEQVTVEFDLEKRSKLILKAFLASKLKLAESRLESMKNTSH